MVVNEIFHSIQGEGTLAGMPSVFIRLAGCPVQCKWCDTKYAWDANDGEELPIPEIVNRIVHWPCRYVVITGGEPMVNPELPDLAKALKKRNKHITIETAGINFVAGLACDLMSISPKLSNSGKKTKTTPLRQQSSGQADPFSPVRQLIRQYPYQLKFVVDSPDDLPEIQQAVEQIGGVSTEKVMLMPQAKTRDELIAKSPMVAQLCKETGYVFCQRLHILLYDGAKGK
ncbi:MAG: 7-carboxy-7-deazaguanine synthase QueE [Sedimentisphaerales bacterium]|jgi:7-carboxy-7-deazaguanine synthase